MFLFPLFLPLFGFLFIILLSRFVKSSYIILLNIINLLLAILATVAAMYEIVLLGSPVLINLGNWISISTFNVQWQFYFDSLSITMVFLVLVISTLVHFYSWEYMQLDPHRLRFISYLSISTFFMLLFVTAGNFLQMFFGREGVGLSSYLLINFWYTRLQANQSAMKAIIINRISDLSLYFSLFLIFFMFGTLDYLAIFGIVNFMVLDPSWILVITFLLFLGAVGKSAQMGLHTWLPDAMEGPTPVSALLHAATMVTAGVYLLIRCSHLLVHASTVLLLILLIGGLTTFIAGSIGCFQNDIKKIIAYSTCSQLGYMFLTCGLVQFSVSFFHLFNHAFSKALLFLGAGSVIHALADEQDIRKMGALFSVTPITYISFFIASLALSGTPYLTGFYSKDLLLELSFFNFTVSGLFVYFLALLSAFFTGFYSARVIYYTFLSWPNGNSNVIIKATESGNVILIVLLILTLLSIFTGYIFKEYFVGFGTNLWMTSIIVPSVDNIILDTELGFIFGSFFSKNKVFPLFVTILAVILAVFFLYFWDNIFQVKIFRVLYEFINQKWFFDVLYSYLVIWVMFFSYNITFKLLDRGVFEFFGGISSNKNLLLVLDKFFRISEFGSVYTYLYFGFFLILIFFFTFI